MAVVVCPTITQSIKECVALLEDTNEEYTHVIEQLSVKIQPVITAYYPPPRTKPTVRLVLPLLADSLHAQRVASYSVRDQLYVRRYIANLIRRDFPEVFMNADQGNNDTSTNTPSKPPPKPHMKKNKDKYNKATRNKKKMNAT